MREKAVDSVAKTCYEKRRQVLSHRLLIILLWTHTQACTPILKFSIFPSDSGSDFGKEDMGPHISCFERTEETCAIPIMILVVKIGS